MTATVAEATVAAAAPKFDPAHPFFHLSKDDVLRTAGLLANSPDANAAERDQMRTNSGPLAELTRGRGANAYVRRLFERRLALVMSGRWLAVSAQFRVTKLADAIETIPDAPTVSYFKTLSTAVPVGESLLGNMLRSEILSGLSDRRDTLADSQSWDDLLELVHPRFAYHLKQGVRSRGDQRYVDSVTKAIAAGERALGKLQA